MAFFRNLVLLAVAGLLVITWLVSTMHTVFWVILTASAAVWVG